MADDQLRERIAAALRDAAHDCDGHCGLDAQQCLNQHPIEATVLHHGVVTHIEGPVDALAEAAAAAVRDELQQAREQLERAHVGWRAATRRSDSLRAERDAARAELATEQRLHSQTIAERDRASDMADRLAATIAPIEEIGEHSIGNCPWQNALDIAHERAADPTT